jgi:hypothetical protein
LNAVVIVAEYEVTAGPTGTEVILLETLSPFFFPEFYYGPLASDKYVTRLCTLYIYMVPLDGSAVTSFSHVLFSVTSDVPSMGSYTLDSIIRYELLPGGDEDDIWDSSGSSYLTRPVIPVLDGNKPTFFITVGSAHWLISGGTALDTTGIVTQQKPVSLDGRFVFDFSQSTKNLKVYDTTMQLLIDADIPSSAPAGVDPSWYTESMKFVNSTHDGATFYIGKRYSVSRDGTGATLSPIVIYGYTWFKYTLRQNADTKVWSLSSPSAVTNIEGFNNPPVTATLDDPLLFADRDIVVN